MKFILSTIQSPIFAITSMSDLTHKSTKTHLVVGLPEFVWGGCDTAGLSHLAVQFYMLICV